MYHCRGVDDTHVVIEQLVSAVVSPAVQRVSILHNAVLERGIAPRVRLHTPEQGVPGRAMHERLDSQLALVPTANTPNIPQGIDHNRVFPSASNVLKRAWYLDPRGTMLHSARTLALCVVATPVQRSIC